MRTTRGGKKKCNTYFETPCTLLHESTQLQFHISKPSNTPTVWKCLKCYFKIPLSCKRYTNHSEDAKLKMALPHLTLDNTNVLTVENIFQNNDIFFFFFFCRLGKLNAHQEFFRKNLAAWLWQKQAYQVQSFHPSLSQCNRNSCHATRVALFVFCT